jgi:Ala-tRNA(Pro) deacylase
MSTETFLQIKTLIESKGFEYKHLVHEHVITSRDAADIRDTNIEDALKAIILKMQAMDGKYEFIQVVIPANERIDLKKLKIILGSKNISLASPIEVLEKTGCSVGSVPPFANLFGLKVYADDSILKKDLVVFSAGTHTDSIQMSAKDYYSLIEPKIIEVKKLF